MRVDFSKYKVPPGYVLVEVSEEEVYGNSGISISSERVEMNRWTRIARVGGGVLSILRVLLVFGYRVGDMARIRKTADTPFVGDDGKSYLVIPVEDVNLIKRGSLTSFDEGLD